jgi:hypothetical protein
MTSIDNKLCNIHETFKVCLVESAEDGSQAEVASITHQRSQQPCRPAAMTGLRSQYLSPGTCACLRIRCNAARAEGKIHCQCNAWAATLPFGGQLQMCGELHSPAIGQVKGEDNAVDERL